MARVSSLKLPLRETIHVDNAGFGAEICLYWNDGSNESPAWIDFEILEAIGTESPGALLSMRSRAAGNTGAPVYYATQKREITDGVTAEIERAVWSARGFVKFDGCTQVYFPEGPLHYDDVAGLRDMFAAICRAQERCYEIMDGAIGKPS